MSGLTVAEVRAELAAYDAAEQHMEHVREKYWAYTQDGPDVEARRIAESKFSLAEAGLAVMCIDLARLVLQQADALAAAEQQAQTLRAALDQLEKDAEVDEAYSLKYYEDTTEWDAAQGIRRAVSAIRAALAPQAGTEGEG